MSEMKHTPAPWRVGYRGIDIGCENQKLGGYAKLLDVRGWGYLTGTGHGGLGLSQEEAASAQEAFTARVVEAVNSYETNTAIIQKLTEALETANTALSDWACLYAPDMGGDERLEEVKVRVGEHGHLAYIADALTTIRLALSLVRKP